jgi:hypothetical protein
LAPDHDPVGGAPCDVRAELLSFHAFLTSLVL